MIRLTRWRIVSWKRETGGSGNLLCLFLNLIVLFCKMRVKAVFPVTRNTWQGVGYLGRFCFVASIQCSFFCSFFLSFLPLWVGGPISLLYHVSVPSSQRALGTLVFEQIGFITHTSWESVGVSQLDAVWKTYWRIWACCRYFGGSLKEVGLCSGLNAVRKWIYHRYFDKSYFSRRREAKASHFFFF